MGLEAAGVQYGARGIEVDDHLRTSNPLVYAAGDVCSRYQFTHTADFAARIVIQNALFHGRKKASALTIPWSPTSEIAHVGMYARDAGRPGCRGHLRAASRRVDRAITDSDGGIREGHVKGTADPPAPIVAPTPVR
jgi:pyruvate/2-oxoglutarate dehydrogenase complex dihydrolipoamide dehydrogenase (E3) component